MECVELVCSGTLEEVQVWLMGALECMVYHRDFVALHPFWGLILWLDPYSWSNTLTGGTSVRGQRKHHWSVVAFRVALPGSTWNQLSLLLL